METIEPPLTEKELFVAWENYISRDADYWSIVDVDYWFGIEYWTPREAAHLVCGIDPNKRDWILDMAFKHMLDNGMPRVFDVKAKRILERDILFHYYCIPEAQELALFIWERIQKIEFSIQRAIENEQLETNSKGRLNVTEVLLWLDERIDIHNCFNAILDKIPSGSEKKINKTGYFTISMDRKIISAAKELLRENPNITKQAAAERISKMEGIHKSNSEPYQIETIIDKISYAEELDFKPKTGINANRANRSD